MDELRKWVRDGKHLPPFLRDFHDQKTFFKWLDHKVRQDVEARKKEHGGHDTSYLGDLTWTTAHVFTIDMFLHFMALCGWTLQRSRKRMEFADIEATVGTWWKEEQDRMYEAMRAHMQRRQGSQTGGEEPPNE